MRINEGLEKVLSRLEEENSDYAISLLDVATAFEEAYNLINGSILANITDFRDGYEEITCRKERYDAIKGKTIYSLNISFDEKEKTLLNVEVSNSGDISWVVQSSTQEQAERIIEEINQPNNSVMENLKMNADISFFSQNRELVLNEKPYVALKMGNFIEGDKPVLVYKEECASNEINKVNGGTRYIRIDQIEGYLKNIKVDERKIPTLAYAYLGTNRSQDIIITKNILERDLRLDMDEEKLQELKSPRYADSSADKVFFFAIGGGFFGAVLGAVGGALILPSCWWLGIIAGAGLPVISSVIYCHNVNKNINFAHNRDAKIEEAKVSLYKTMRSYANDSIVEFEKEFTRKRSKSQKKKLNLGQNLSTSEIIRELKKTLSDENSLRAEVYNLALAQIVNAYKLKPSTESEKIKRDAEFYTDLIKLSEDIKDMDTQPIGKLWVNVLSIIKEKVDQGDNNLTIQILSNFDKMLSSTGLLSAGDKKTIKNTLEKTYLEALINGTYQKNGLSVETISEIPISTRSSLLERLSAFATRIQGLNVDKFHAGSHLYNVVTANTLYEAKLLTAVNVIKEKELEFDLLGKVPTAKVKTK